MTFDELEENYYEDLNGCITSVRLVESVFHFDFEFDHWSAERHRVFATISCSNVAESTVSVGYLGGIARSNDDPLLWDRNEPHDFLFFSSVPSNPFELLGRLYNVHHRMFHGYREPSRYLQTNADVLQKGVGQ